MRLNFGALLCLRLSPLQGLIPLNSIARKNVPCSKTFMTVRYPDDPSSDWGEEPGDVDEMMDVTNTLLDSSAAPGSLSGESLDDFFPLMLWWGKQASEDGALAVQKLLSRLDDEIDAGKSAPKPRYKYYTLALDAWGKAGYIEQAESILSRMEDLGRFDATFSPTRVTYNAMMNAYVKQGDVERAARILEAMEETSDLVPIVNDYNTILAGYAKLGCAKKAEYLVQRMISLSREQGSSESVPDVYSYYALLDAWAKSDEPGRGLRAQEILSTLIEKSENGEFEWTPDGRIFSTVITALARSGGSMDQIGQLWSDAVARGLGSDAYVTSALLDANASSGLFDSAESAEKILEKLEKEGLVNGVAYNTVLKAWKINGGEQAVASAEHLFKRMKALGLDDAFSYCTLIALHADQGNRKSAERAEEILLDMKDTTLIPNVETLNAGTFLHPKVPEQYICCPTQRPLSFPNSDERMDKVRRC